MFHLFIFLYMLGLLDILRSLHVIYIISDFQKLIAMESTREFDR